MIVSDNKPSSVSLQQNHAILFIETLKQMPFVLNFKMSKIMWDGAEELTINNFIKLTAGNFEYAL